MLTALSFAALWMGLVPQRFSPFAPLNISEPTAWFLDFRLAALKQDRALCAAVLRAPAIEASAVDDQPYKDGCGWKNAVKIATTAGARIGAEPVTCETAAAFAMWFNGAVQPAALKHFGKRVRSIQHLGTYSCRNIVGNKLWQDFRSQHATANAIDVASLTLDDGRTISVKKDWSGAAPEAAFLHDIHAEACHFFRVALGPGYNAAHADHFHLDRGFLKTCR
jgi:hypothetical protein